MSLPSRLTLLIVEDSAEWQGIIANALASDCDLVASVERGDQILNAARKFRPELITLDITLPGGSGLNALPHLRVLLPESIVIVITSTASDIYKQEACARGADAYIEKRNVLSSLVEALASARKKRSKPTADHFESLVVDGIVAVPRPLSSK